jgi:hypothetical protein
MAVDIKLLGPQDAGVLASIAPDVVDDPIDAGRAAVARADDAEPGAAADRPRD